MPLSVHHRDNWRPRSLNCDFRAQVRPGEDAEQRRIAPDTCRSCPEYRSTWAIHSSRLPHSSTQVAPRFTPTNEPAHLQRAGLALSQTLLLHTALGMAFPAHGPVVLKSSGINGDTTGTWPSRLGNCHRLADPGGLAAGTTGLPPRAVRVGPKYIQRSSLGRRAHDAKSILFRRVKFTWLLRTSTDPHGVDTPVGIGVTGVPAVGEAVGKPVTDGRT